MVFGGMNNKNYIGSSVFMINLGILNKLNN